MKTLPHPTAEERAKAAEAARALRHAIAVPASMGEESVVHLDLCRPRRGVWVSTWSNLPGFTRTHTGLGIRYTHDLLPGWEYSRREVVVEMIPDLEALAERGVRPTEATR